ncbi:hypothetical protein K3495_g7240 [Podosphaera aphanis]|nr:hypothetical protein K3495_g7240 [Podosphaera aphanis]
MHHVLTRFRTRSFHPRHALLKPGGLRHTFISRTQAPTLTPAPTSTSSDEETIYALSTAPGRAALATVRVSGPHCLQIYQHLCPSKAVPRPRHATLRQLVDARAPTTVVDTAALVLYFPAPATVTGEDVLELQIHGGPATQRAVLRAIANVAVRTALPIRYAEPGEFTRRAFYHGKMDLIQIEALADTLAADTEQQRRAAVRGDSGALGIIYERWRAKLLLARGELEALIDFAEDQHFDEAPQELIANVIQQVDAILAETSRHDAASRCGELLKRGVRISLLGPPNVGKSSLLNRIVGREASIVSQEAGTTRDVVEVSLDMRGYLCTFADTAGLRNESPSRNTSDLTIGAVEQEGIRRAKLKATNSDIIIVMASLEQSQHTHRYSIKYDHESLVMAAKAAHALIVVNKCDVAIPPEISAACIRDFQAILDTIFTSSPPPPIMPICCLPDEVKDITTAAQGKIQDLISELVVIFDQMTQVPVDMYDLIGVTERQRLLLTSCCAHLHDFKDVASTDIVLAAEHLRLAAGCLARVTGRGDATDVEELLGVVFEKYIPVPLVPPPAPVPPAHH